MSETVTYIGKLTPIDREGLSVDEWIQKTLNIKEKPEYETWMSHYSEEQYMNKDSYPEIFYNPTTDTLYQVSKEKLNPYDFVHSILNEDGSYSFTVSYYNGGASLSEVLEDVVENR